MTELEILEETADTGTMPIELTYLKKLILHRIDFELKEADPSPMPAMPRFKLWNLPLKNFILEEKLTPAESTILLAGLAIHIQPDIFDPIKILLEKESDFPKFGGIRGKNFRGFMPTGETALFLLAGNDWRKKLEIQKIFWADHLFAKKRILWLEDITSGEPAMSGQITLSQDFIDIFTQDKMAPPHFNMNFPARLVTTDREKNDLVIDSHLKSQMNDLLDFLKHNKGLLGIKGNDGRFKNGYRSLFYGPSGTGKTFAACLLGKETQRDVYRIDLSMIVSKYIGETEKNLELLFARAESKKWILFFDEADALFGKRTNVRDAHDKYANQEVSYLLQRIEDYDGLVILATNMRNNIDDAFIRRFTSVLNFPMPDENNRKKIWENTFLKNTKFILDTPGKSNPSGFDGHDEAYQDLPEMVKKYELSGGNIANIIHYASIKGKKRRDDEKKKQQDHALMDGTPSDNAENSNEETPPAIYLSDVMSGIRHELSKDGIPFM